MKISRWLRPIGVQGMSLVEIVIGVGVISLSVMAIASLLSYQTRQNAFIQFQANATSTNDEMRALLSSEEACRNSFNGVLANASTNLAVADLKDGSVSPGVIRYQQNIPRPQQ